MRKITIAALLVMMASVFAMDWYGSKGKVENRTLREEASKDSLPMWYTYVQTAAWAWTIDGERATYYNVNDFGLHYPIDLHALSAYLNDNDYPITYKIYDKDGVTLLYETPSQLSAANIDGNDYYFDTPLTLKDDFWMAVVPDPASAGLPSHVTSDVLPSSHSYIGDGEGNWDPLYDGSDYYEYVNYVGLADHYGEDFYPPNYRGVTNTLAFMNTDCNIVCTVEDQSNIVSPTTGQYSLDGGDTWTDFEVSYIADEKGPSRGQLFGGPVPGQDDGVTAQVKVYFEDELGYNSWSDIFEVSWSMDVPLLYESFEGDFPPEGWTLETTGDGFEQCFSASGAYVHEGAAGLMHYSYNNTQDDWIWTPEFYIPVGGACQFSFWNISVWCTYYGLHEVVITTDGGLTTTQIFEGPGETTDEDPDMGVWTQYPTFLKDYAGETAQIGFHYAGGWDAEWYIDEVSILFDGHAPEITDVMANETLYPNIQEYYNNDMNIAVTFDDLVGVKEATAYYTFDDGVTWTDVAMTMSKFEEVWTCTLPSRSDDTPGKIYFTYVDNGDNAGQSEEYDISFEPDENKPVIVSFDNGEPVFINEDMNLELVFTDESSISSMTGYYSKDDWVTSTEIPMIPAKHLYTYVGTIPAETEITYGEVMFMIGDAAGNMMESPVYDARWLEGAWVVEDDFESGQNAFWDWTTPETLWDITDEDSYNGTYSLTDTPGGNYPDETDNRLMSTFQDFTAFLSATAYFWLKVDVEPEWEFFMFQYTTSTEAVPADDAWVTLGQWDGLQADDPGWKYCNVNLGSIAQMDSVRIRLKIDSDQAVNFDGVHIDDFKIVGYAGDFAPPVIIYSGPDYLQGAEYDIPRVFTIPVGMGDYTFSADISDPSDISMVKVIYSVDGGAWQESIPATSSGLSGTYELSIPEQEAGAKVVYKIFAADNTIYQNDDETKTYTIHFGNWNHYDNGDDAVDFYAIIGTVGGTNGHALAKRITMGPESVGKGHYRSTLAALTMEIYTKEEDPTEDIIVHVWANDNGVPGEDLITPFFHEAACDLSNTYEITWVDLRPYSAELSNIEGDVFVGFESSGSQTNILFEVVDGDEGFERSYLGWDNVGDDGVFETWEHDPTSVYHVGAVIGNYEYIDGPPPPVGFKALAGPSDQMATLSWSQSAESYNVVQYHIYRDVTPDFALVTPIATVLSTDPLTYEDTGLDPDVFYYYKITAEDDLGFESAPSVEIEVHPTGIEGNIPLTTELFQNYPNPFNPDTAIKFNLAENAEVKLTVYNSKGELVSKLVEGPMKAGYYSTSFRSSNLVSGMYYYTLKVNDKVMTRKMMLIK